MTTTSTGAGEWNSVVGAYDISDDVIINHDVTYDDHIDMTGSLTINASKTLGEGAASKNMTVDGDVTVNGVLDLDRSSSDGNATFDSLTNNGTVHAPSHGTITILSETGSGRCVDMVGTYNHNNGTLIIKTPADTDLRWPSNDDIYNLTINHASAIVRPTGDMDGSSNGKIAGNLTITAGTFNTLDSGGSTSHELIVAGTTQVTGTLTCNSSTISLGTGLTSGWGLDIQSGGTFTGGSGIHTIGSIFAAGGGTRTITLSSGATTIDSKNTGNGFTINLASGATFNHGGGTVTMTYAGNTLIQLSGGTLAFNTFTYNASGRTLELRSPMSCAGNLTLTAGTLDTKSGTNHALTVTGDVSVAGTLTCNSSTVQCRGMDVSGSGTLTAPDASGSLTITGTQTGSSGNDAFDTESGTTFTHSSGTITFTGNTNPQIRNRSGESFNNIVINTTGGTPIVETQRDIAIAGTLTIVEGTFRSYGTNARTITVTGDVSVEDGGTLGGGSANTANHSFGSLTIASGGTYLATSGTTTITSETSGGFAMVDQGTFTHNNGTIQIGDGSTSVGSGTHTKVNTFYNLTVNMASTTVIMLMRPNSGSTMTVLNNVKVQNGVLTKNSHTNTFDFKGLVTVGIGGGSLAAHIDSTTSGTATDNFGALTILTDGKYTQPTTTNVSSIRNVGGTIA